MKNIVKYVCIISFLLLSTAEIYANNKLPIKPINLKTEYLINPIGIDVITPRLSWEIKDGGLTKCISYLNFKRFYSLNTKPLSYLGFWESLIISDF